LPRESSNKISDELFGFVDEIVIASETKDFSKISAEIERGFELEIGKLTERYKYLQEYL